MFAYPIRTAALAAAAMIGLSGCTGLYNGFSVGVGNGGYYDPYYGGYGYGSGYGRYGYSGYGFDPYWGWYDNFYYPGTGFYVYDVYRRPYRWTDAHRRYWELRRQRALSTSRDRVVIRNNWDDFNSHRDGFGRVVRKVDRVEQVERSVDSPVRVERRVDRPSRVERKQERVERRQQQRAERSSARVERKSETRSEQGRRPSRENRANEREE
jgi:hypothetical protein